MSVVNFNIVSLVWFSFRGIEARQACCQMIPICMSVWKQPPIMDIDYNVNDIEQSSPSPRLDAFGLSIWAPSVLSLLTPPIQTPDYGTTRYRLQVCTPCQKILAMPLDDFK